MADRKIKQTKDESAGAEPAAVDKAAMAKASADTLKETNAEEQYFKKPEYLNINDLVFETTALRPSRPDAMALSQQDIEEIMDYIFIADSKEGHKHKTANGVCGWLLFTDPDCKTAEFRTSAFTPKSYDPASGSGSRAEMVKKPAAEYLRNNSADYSTFFMLTAVYRPTAEVSAEQRKLAWQEFQFWLAVFAHYWFSAYKTAVASDEEISCQIRGLKYIMFADHRYEYEDNRDPAAETMWQPSGDLTDYEHTKPWHMHILANYGHVDIADQTKPDKLRQILQIFLQYVASGGFMADLKQSTNKERK